MGALETLLNYKAQKEAQKNADINAIPQAMAQFQAGRQQASDNLIKQLTLQATLAKSGLRLGPGNQLVVDQSLPANQKSILDQQFKQSQINKNNAYVQNQPSVLEQKVENQQANRASGLRKEFNALPSVKDYQTVKNQVSSMDALLNASETDKQSALALDQGLITMFNKITDPKSVVRESEYARTPENLSLVNKLSGAVEKLKNGGAGLTKDDRKALVFGAKLIANQYGKNYNSVLDNYNELAVGMKVKPELVTQGYGRHEDFSTSGLSNAQEFNVNGVVYRIPSEKVAEFKKAKGLK